MSRVLVGSLVPSYANRTKLTAAAIGGALGAIICTPPYVIERIGILMLGSSRLFIPDLLILTLGVTLQAGATGAIKAIKVSAKLIGGHSTPTDTAPSTNPTQKTSGQQRSS